VLQRRALRHDLQQLVDLLLVFGESEADLGVLDRERHFRRHRILVERYRDAAEALHRVHHRVEARAVVAHQREVFTARQSSAGEPAGQRAHFLRELEPAAGLPDAEILFADRRP
jgi:hypothetical protein